MKISSVYYENINLANFYQKELDNKKFKVNKMLLANTGFLNLIKKENLKYIADFSEKQNPDFNIKKLNL